MIYVVAWIDSKCRKKNLSDLEIDLELFCISWCHGCHQFAFYHGRDVFGTPPCIKPPGSIAFRDPDLFTTYLAITTDFTQLLIIWTCNKYSSTYTKYPCFIQSYRNTFSILLLVLKLHLDLHSVFPLKEPLVCSHPKGSLLSPQHLPRPRCWEHRNMKFCSTAWQQRFIAEITSWLITGFWNSSFWICAILHASASGGRLGISCAHSGTSRCTSGIGCTPKSPVGGSKAMEILEILMLMGQKTNILLLPAVFPAVFEIRCPTQYTNTQKNRQKDTLLKYPCSTWTNISQTTTPPFQWSAGLSKPLQCLKLSSSGVAAATPPPCIRHHLETASEQGTISMGKRNLNFMRFHVLETKTMVPWEVCLKPIWSTNDLVKKPLAKAPGRKRWDASRPQNVLHLTCWTSWLFFVKPSKDGKPSLFGWPHKQNVDATVFGLTRYHNSFEICRVWLEISKDKFAKHRKSGDSTAASCG